MHLAALLFALFTLAMLLAYFDLGRISGLIFGIGLVLSVYWLKFHATSQLGIQL